MITLRAKDIMTHEIKGIGPERSVVRLAEFFMENGISGAPVIDARGHLQGVVTHTDIVRHCCNPVRNSRSSYSEDKLDYFMTDPDTDPDPEVVEWDGLEPREESTTTVADIMNPVLFDVEPDTLILQVADTMLRGRIHRIFVTEGKQLVGIITALDLLNVFRKQFD